MKRKHNFKDRTGERYLSNENCWMTIIEYFSTFNCTIQFDDGTILKNRQFGDIKRGNVKNPYHPFVYGKGYIGIGSHIPPFKGEYVKIYKTWNHMLERCYSIKWLENNPAYKRCSSDKEWHNFQNFADWAKQNFNSEIMKGWALDKDILVKGNKIYSPKTCCFVPQEINSLLTSCKSVRGKYPIGVTKKLKRYEARVNKRGDRISLGYFDTPEEAFEAYKIGKELYIKEVADKWRGQITEECYQAMYKYEVEITD